MNLLKMIGISILKFLGVCILATVMALATIFTYFPLQLLLFGIGEYLLFISSEINIIPLIMIMILIIYTLFQIKEKLFKNKGQTAELTEEVIENSVDNQNESIEIPIDAAEGKRGYILLVKLLNVLLRYDKKLEKIYKIIKACYLPALIIAVYCGMTSYTILYENYIKVSTPIAPISITYDYDDINNVDVGIGKYKNTYTPYYKITLKDGKKADIFGGSISENSNANFEEILVCFDNALEKKGIKKNVDKSNFEKFAKGLDINYIKEIEKLFE